MSPFKSRKQMKYLKIHHPEVYYRWKAKYGTKIIKNGDLPSHVPKNKISREVIPKTKVTFHKGVAPSFTVSDFLRPEDKIKLKKILGKKR